MLLETLWRNGELSNRAYNVCRRKKIPTVDSLHQFYSQNGGFKKLENCGAKTEKELIKLLKALSVVKNPSNIRELKDKDLINSLNRTQREIINIFLSLSINSISNRSRNSIKEYVTGKIYSEELTIANFGDKILYNNDFHIEKLTNIGNKSIPEVQGFLKKTRQFVDEISLTQNEKELNILRNKYLLEKMFGLKEIPRDILETHEYLPLIQYIIKSNVLYKNQTLNYVLKEGFEVFKNMEVKSMEEMANQLNLSSERVRQLKRKCSDTIQKKFNFLKNSSFDMNSEFGTTGEGIFVRIDSNNINAKSKTDFSNNFLLLLFYWYSQEDYELIGDFEEVLSKKGFVHRNKHNWKNLYLIKKSHSSLLDFELMLNDVHNRLNNRIEETYNLNLKSYVHRFNENLSINSIVEILPFVEYLLTSETEVLIDVDDNIVFRRNTLRKNSEYAFEMLEEYGKPAKLEKIQALINEQYPDIWINIDSLRSSLLREDLFVSIGRKSTYGLKKWEVEKENFKGGTIRSISEEYLEKLENPAHISSITEEVLKYRPKTNSKSILHNLKLDESKTFIFFQNSYVGLKRKNYGDKIKVSKSSKKVKVDWKESYKSVEDFIINNQRLPFYNGADKEETKMNRWYHLQLKKGEEGKLTNMQELMLEQLHNHKILFKDFQSYKDKESYIQLIEFIELHKRPPSVTNEEEASLYRFYYRVRKFSFDRILNEELRRLHTELFNQLEIYEYQ